MRKETKVKIDFLMDSKLAEVFKDFCEKNNIEEADFIEQAIIEKLETEELKSDIEVFEELIPEKCGLTESDADFMFDSGIFDKKKH